MDPTPCPSITRDDYSHVHSVPHLLRKCHNSRGSTHIPRHWSHPLRHFWATFASTHATLEILELCSSFTIFGGVFHVIWGLTHTCGVYDSHVGVLGDDMTWIWTFLALWSTFSWCEGLAMPWRLLLMIPWAHYEEAIHFWGHSPCFCELVPLGGEECWRFSFLGGYFTFFWGLHITLSLEHCSRGANWPHFMWDLPLS